KEGEFNNAHGIMEKKRVIVVGAGPAGLTAAIELVKKGHAVTVLERDPEYVGGLARTLSYKGFRFDVGAHRFFSKNPEIARWWRERLPNDFIPIKRLTRILYRHRFFDYPLKPGNALKGLGILSSLGCVLSYFWRRSKPIRPERSFEDWVVNRFGDRLYQIFFKTYTEKVWGMPCSEISADWASQRIKGLSLSKAILNAFRGEQSEEGVTKTLIDHFEYPRFGAGMLWERTRDEIVECGGSVLMGRKVTGFRWQSGRIAAVRVESKSGETEECIADEFIISMPLPDCVSGMEPALEVEVRAAARKLLYRDFILVALIVNRTELFPDNWIYVHDPEVKVGRIENFNNWTREMVPRPGVTCLEFEYFCSREDEFWKRSDEEILSVAKAELEKLGLAKASEVLDGCVVRIEKAYPVYDSEYRNNVEIIRTALGRFENLQVIGRNGMHKYNNQDHSMLTGILAAQNVSGEQHDVWQVNTDAEYHEEHRGESGRQMPRILSPE
ncbi:MAG TPA: NAD(P)/FAD-dependent oxidoreductase, partial [Candidatus Paceibacterota bacterium]|nr:NAD(P)/FAD-dependent oxidoreductase [Candidatus Paceibacterota bacterium]